MIYSGKNIKETRRFQLFLFPLVIAEKLYYPVLNKYGGIPGTYLFAHAKDCFMFNTGTSVHKLSQHGYARMNIRNCMWAGVK